MSTTPPSWIVALGSTDAESLSILLSLTVVVLSLFLAGTQWLYEWLFSAVALGMRHSLRMQVYDQLLELGDVGSFEWHVPAQQHRRRTEGASTRTATKLPKHNVSSLAAANDVAYHSLSPTTPSAAALAELLSNMNDIPPGLHNATIQSHASNTLVLSLIEDANRIEVRLQASISERTIGVTDNVCVRVCSGGCARA